VTDILGKPASAPGPVRAADTSLYRGGVVDVELLGGLTRRVEGVISHLRAADREIRAMPTLPYFPQLDEVRRQAIADTALAIRLAERTHSAVRLLPSFLGAGGTKTYLVALGRRIDVPLAPGLAWYVAHVKEAYPSIDAVNYSPDFPHVADAWARMVSKVTGLRIDGVIHLDQTAAARMLGSGKVRVPAYPKPITGGNLVKVVTRDQFVLPRAKQLAFPAELIVAVWPKILDPGSLQVALHDLGRSLAEKRIQLWSAEPGLRERLGELGWDGGVRVRRGDYLYVVDDKVVPNRVDPFSRISIDYHVTLDRSGNASATLEVTLTNDSPPGLPRSIARPLGKGRYAVNRALMLAFVPEQAEIVEAVPEAGLPDHVESGAKVFARVIEARAGEATTMRLRYTIARAVVSTGTRRLYRLTVQHQPLIVPAGLRVTVALPAGTTARAAPRGWIVKGNVLTLETQLTRDMVHEIVF
jgi:uncharacterized protein DUF4012